MDLQTIIDELTEFRTLIEGCDEERCINGCPYEDECLKFGNDHYYYTCMIIDAAIEKLREKNE